MSYTQNYHILYNNNNNHNDNNDDNNNNNNYAGYENFINYVMNDKEIGVNVCFCLYV